MLLFELEIVCHLCQQWESWQGDNRLDFHDPVGQPLLDEWVEAAHAAKEFFLSSFVDESISLHDIY